MFNQCDYCFKNCSNKLKLCSKCLKCGYCSKECQKFAWQSHKFLCSSSVEILNVKTKDSRNSSNSMKGLFARKSFQVGDIILKEKPLMAVPYADMEHIDQQIETSFNQLSQASKKAVYDLCDTTLSIRTKNNIDSTTITQTQITPNLFQIEDNNNDVDQDIIDDNINPNIKTLRGILKSNSIPQGNASSVVIEGKHELVLPTACLYSLSCRANHSCNNNAIFTWRNDLQKELLIAMRNIQKGDEITVSYDGVCGERDYRRQRLQDNFNFDCNCILCVNNDQKIEEGLELIANLKYQINFTQSGMDTKAANDDNDNDNDIDKSREECEDEDELAKKMRTDLCISMGEKALATAIEINMNTPMHLQHLHETLALLYYKTGMEEQAIKHYQQFTLFKDICYGNRV